MNPDKKEERRAQCGRKREEKKVGISPSGIRPIFLQ